MVVGNDKEGNYLCPGDIVIDSDGFEREIIKGKYREKFDCGYVIGYFIPDGCILKTRNPIYATYDFQMFMIDESEENYNKRIEHYKSYKINNG